MDISPFIREQIMLNECVILRGIGGFETSYREATYDSSKKVLHPPTKIISFHPDWVKDNGILESSLSNTLGIPRKKASEHIDDFVEDFHYQLKHQGIVSIKDLGEFRLDSGNSIVFKELQNENYLADSFGLEDLNLEFSTAVPGSASTHKLLHTFWYFILGVLVFLIAGTSLLLVSSGMLPKVPEFNMASGEDQPEVIVFGNNNTEKDTVLQMIEKSLDEKSSVKQALSMEADAYSQTIAETPSYYIIAGSFKTQEKASVLKEQLLRQGFDPVVLVMGNHVRVVIGTYKDKGTALNELRRIRMELDQSVWLLTH